MEVNSPINPAIRSSTVFMRFDALTANTAIDQSTTFGSFNKTLTVPRVMQFALRYSF